MDCIVPMCHSIDNGLEYRSLTELWSILAFRFFNRGYTLILNDEGYTIANLLIQRTADVARVNLIR